jgi:hypothetical protein
MLRRGSGVFYSRRPCPFQDGSTRTLRTVTEPEWVMRRSSVARRGDGERRTRHATYLANKLEAFPRADVSLPSLLDFGEYPWLDERAASDHDTVYVGGVEAFPV